MADLGKMLMALGAAIAALGAVLFVAARVGIPLGRLPGDFAWRGKHASVYFPLGTCILISLFLTLVLYLLSRFHR